jgi:hypothetical protein
VTSAARQIKAVFAGCARDCAGALPAVLANVDAVSALYTDTASVFVENDSRDATKAVLDGWGKGKNAHIIDLNGLAAIEPRRTPRLAFARHQYVERVKRDFPDYSDLVVFDCDDVNTRKLDLDAVARAIDFLESDPAHAAVFCNQIGIYYDMWAFRHPDMCPGDVWEEVLDYATTFNVPDQEAFDQTFAKRIFSLPRDTEPLEVDSAFGGLGIYKIGAILGNRRDFVGSKRKEVRTNVGVRKMGWQLCEHVAFHTGLREQGGRLFVLPYLINGVTEKLSFPPSAFRGILFEPSPSEESIETRLTAHRNFRLPNGFQRNDPCPCGSGKKAKHCHGAVN